MRRLLIALLAVTSMSFTFSTTTAQAAEADTQTGTVVVFREKSRQRASYKVFLQNSSIGRLDINEYISVELPVGDYIVGSSLPTKENITVSVRSGETTYVNSQLVKRSNKFKVSYNEVDQDLAIESMPDLQGQI
ncbi:MAG: hypothetical protein V7711_00835 [Pseudomonadales bacterium]